MAFELPADPVGLRALLSPAKDHRMKKKKETRNRSSPIEDRLLRLREAADTAPQHAHHAEYLQRGEIEGQITDWNSKSPPAEMPSTHNLRGDQRTSKATMSILRWPSLRAM